MIETTSWYDGQHFITKTLGYDRKKKTSSRMPNYLVLGKMVSDPRICSNEKAVRYYMT